MTCLIIGTIWVALRFIKGIFIKMTGHETDKEWDFLSYFLWFFGWVGNIALLIIGICTV